jgi:hypothetical protein
LPDFVFLGFCAKRTVTAPFAVPVREIASVSSCLSNRPDKWANRWDFNRATCWNTEADAWACVPEQSKGAFRMYAYRLLPLLFDKSGIEMPVTIDQLFPKACPKSQRFCPTRGLVTTLWSEVQRWGFSASDARPLLQRDGGEHTGERISPTRRLASGTGSRAALWGRATRARALRCR